MDRYWVGSSSPKASDHRAKLASSLRDLAFQIESDSFTDNDLLDIEREIGRLRGFPYISKSTQSYLGSPVRVTKLLPRTKAAQHASIYKVGSVYNGKSDLKARSVDRIGALEAAGYGRPDSEDKASLSASSLSIWQSAMSREQPLGRPSYGRVILGSPDSISSHSAKDLESRLEQLVVDFQLRQEEAMNIAILAAHQAASSETELARLQDINAKLRENVNVSMSGLRVLAARMQSLHERVARLGADGLTDHDKENGVARLQRSVRDWLLNHDSLIKRLQQKNDSNDAETGETDTLSQSEADETSSLNGDFDSKLQGIGTTAPDESGDDDFG